MNNHRQIYTTVVSLLERRPMSREELINLSIEKLSGKRCSYDGSIGDYSALRGSIGEVIGEMADTGVIAKSDDKYTVVPEKPIALRAENCEREIIALLSREPLSKDALRSRLEKYFGTDKTPSLKDDSTLHSLIGQILKRLTCSGLITLRDGKYCIAPERHADIDDINAIVSLRADFINQLHAKGGEFFEHYIMTLLGKYLSKNGKTVLENRVQGGTQDGGIDGMLKTVDTLGFRETIMVQAKNRIELTSETTVRGFYGSVCAKQGSRGIFATTSDFHASATEFLNEIDNCVGVNGDMIFKMALECEYGIKRKGKKYKIDLGGKI